MPARRGSLTTKNQASILQMLTVHQMSAQQLSEKLNIPASTVHQVLGKLKTMQLVTAQHEPDGVGAPIKYYEATRKAEMALYIYHSE